MSFAPVGGENGLIILAFEGQIGQDKVKPASQAQPQPGQLVGMYEVHDSRFVHVSHSRAVIRLFCVLCYPSLWESFHLKWHATAPSRLLSKVEKTPLWISSGWIT